MHLANAKINIAHRMLENQWHNFYYKDLSRGSLSEITSACVSVNGYTVRAHSSDLSLIHYRKGTGSGKRQETTWEK